MMSNIEIINKLTLENLKKITIHATESDLRKICAVANEVIRIDATNDVPTLYYIKPQVLKSEDDWEIHALVTDLTTYSLLNSIKEDDIEPGPDPGPDPDPSPGPINHYLTFTAGENGTNLGFYINEEKGQDLTLNPSLEYSKNNGETWSTYEIKRGGDASVITDLIDLGPNESVMFKGINTTFASSSIESVYTQFYSSDAVSASGDITSLLNGGEGGDVALTGPRTFYRMFRYTPLIEAPNLPSTTLSNFCYGEMFQDCESLVEVPSILPAENLSDYCYSNMFEGCASLTTAPSLPATTLAESCYRQMFEGCASLTTAPSLPATNLAESCYQNMFSNCTSLEIAPELSATTLAEYCCYNMFGNCTSLTTAPSILPAENLSDCRNCYGSMFQGCTSLTTAPELPATTLSNGCYVDMFKGCESLEIAPELPSTTLSNDCYSSMFEGCTSLETAPELKATTLTVGCYRNMFNGCSRLNEVTCLATNISANYCIYNWLMGVPSGGIFYKNSSVNIIYWPRNASGIPNDWNYDDYSE